MKLPRDDLQKDEEPLPKAAILYGAILEIKAALNEHPDQQKRGWENRGKKGLKDPNSKPKKY